MSLLVVRLQNENERLIEENKKMGDNNSNSSILNDEIEHLSQSLKKRIALCFIYYNNYFNSTKTILFPNFVLSDQLRKNKQLTKNLENDVQERYFNHES